MRPAARAGHPGADRRADAAPPGGRPAAARLGPADRAGHLGPRLERPQLGTVTVFVVVAVVSYEQARRRDRVGVRRARPDRILLELRERLRVQGEVPPLPPGGGSRSSCARRTTPGWPATSWSPGCTPDRTAAHPGPGPGRRLRQGRRRRHPGAAAVRRVRRAARRGAAGALPRSRPTATCASSAGARASPPRSTCGSTCDTGEYRLESAGHPPAAHLDAGSGTWQLSRPPRPAARRGARGRPPAGHRPAAPRRRRAALLRRRRRGPQPRHRGRRRPPARRGRAPGPARRLHRRRRLPGHPGPVPHRRRPGRVLLWREY